MSEVILEALRSKNLQNRKNIVELLRSMQLLIDELAVLGTAWQISGDDDRRAKRLNVSPSVARNWRMLTANSRNLRDRIKNELQLEEEHGIHS